MKYLTRFFILGAIAALLAGCKSPTETELNHPNGIGYLYAGTNDGVFRSTDNGLTWRRADSGLTGTSIQSLACNNTFLFAATYGQGVFRSFDDGQSWAPANNGLQNLRVLSLLANGSCMYAGFDHFFGPAGVFLSTDLGENWSQTGLTGMDTYPLAAIGQFIFAGSVDNEGIFRSSDRGSSWRPVNNGLSSQNIHVLSVVGQTLFAGTDSCLFRSNDSGESWQYANLQGYVISFIGAGNNLLAGLDGLGFYLSTDNGNDWTQVNNSAISRVNVLASDGFRFFAGTSGNGVFVSTDSGATWSASNKGIDSEWVETLAIH